MSKPEQDTWRFTKTYCPAGMYTGGGALDRLAKAQLASMAL